MNTTLDWPPPFTVCYSPRARSICLKICARRGLQIIVPPGFKEKKAPDILLQQRRWIERTWARIQSQSSLHEQRGPDVLPQQLTLLAVDEQWQIHYEASDSAIIRLIKGNDQQLSLQGNIHNPALVKVILQRWLHQRAQHYLVPWLARLSTQTDLCYTQVNIRNATTRWGSCSAKKRISLNRKLLFLPPLLVEHVLLHELCHIVHLNHSRQFWDLLKRVNPDCHQLRKQLKQANHYLPAWLEE